MSEDLEARLDELYGGLASGFQTPTPDRDQLDRRAGRGAAAYGEITDAGAARVLAWLRPGPDDVLVDLGSGTGRFLLHSVCATPVGAAVGVELSPHRHAVAVAARQRLPPADAARVRLHETDLRSFDWRDATLVWVGSTCFPSAVLGHVARAVPAAPRLRRLLTTQELPAGARYGVHEVGRLAVSMTWADDVDVFVYAGAAG